MLNYQRVPCQYCTKNMPMQYRMERGHSWWMLGSAAPFARREALGIAAMGGAICTVETELGSQTCPDINAKGHMSKAAADGICWCSSGVDLNFQLTQIGAQRFLTDSSHLFWCLCPGMSFIDMWYFKNSGIPHCLWNSFFAAGHTGVISFHFSCKRVPKGDPLFSKSLQPTKGQKEHGCSLRKTGIHM